MNRLLPESVRWLITKERYEEAEKILLKTAKINQKTIPSNLLIAPEDQGEHVKNVCIIQKI